VKLDLPEQRVLYREIQTISLQLDRGIIPGAAHYRSKKRFIGRGERMGLRNAGKLRDLDITSTVIKGEPIYRDDRIAPKRRVRLMVDLSTLDNSPATRRLLSVAAVVCGAILALPDAEVTLAAFGCQHQISPYLLSSTGDLRIAIGGLKAYSKEIPDSRLNAGKIRMACGDTNAIHIVIVTHYLDPDLLLSVRFPLGCTVFLVEPSRDILTSSSFGIFGGLAAFGPSISLHDEIEEKYANFRKRTISKLGASYVVSARKNPLTAVRQSINQRS
jgi:hypothetical protein